MKWILPVTIAVLALLAKGDVTAQCNPTTCRARTLDLRAGFVINHSGNTPQSLVGIDTAACQWLYNGANAYAQINIWQMAYDTAKKFLTTCPSDYPLTGHIFGITTQAIQGMGNSPELKAEYLGWLKSVLYDDTIHPEYFCACVEAIQSCVPLPNDTTPGWQSRTINYGLAVQRWLILNTACDSPTLWKEYKQSRLSQFEQWQNDPSAYPLDTTLPTMQDLGLDTLLNKHFLYASVDQPKSIILNAAASPNPVSTGTVITFGINQEAYVKINLFNVLGVPVSGGRGPGSGGEGYEGLFQPGNHEVPLSLQGLPSGTYYARILTAFGSVATVKLVKE